MRTVPLIVARRSFKAGSREPHHRKMCGVLGSYSILGGEISHATKEIPHPIRHYGRKLHRKMNVRLTRGGEVVACYAAGRLW